MYRGAGLLLFAATTGRCLLLLRSDDGTWGVPGGLVDPGEHPVDAALRELAEETGYTGTVVIDAHEPYVSRRYALYVAHVPREFRPRLDHEHLSATWAHFQRPPRPLHRGLKKVFAPES